VTYGLSPQADIGAEKIEVSEGTMHFDVRRSNEILGRVALNMIGGHNVANALAAVAVAEEVGINFETTQKALASFEGIARRFEVKGHVDDIIVIDDYGHHPEEIRATLSAAREAYDRRLIAVFQPHRYTRTRNQLDDFATAFNACHVLLVTDIYAAGEAPIEGVSSKALVVAMHAHGHHDVRHVGPKTEVATVLRDIVKPGDLVLTLGAGDVWQAGEELLVYLRELETHPVGLEVTS